MRPLLLALLALLSACQNLPPPPDWQSPEGRHDPRLGLIQDLRSGERLTPGQLVERLADQSRVLVGEQHDNPDHHALQLWLLRALESRRAQGSLLLEMLEPAQQASVDAVHKGPLPADLPSALAWRPSWDWTLYGPVVTHALAQPYPLLAANLDRDEIKRLYRERPQLQGERSTRDDVSRSLLAQIRESHCGMLPESQLPAMLAVQQQRDRRMAERLLAAPVPAMLLAGGFHVRRDLGVPLHLEDLGQTQGTAVLMLAEVGKPVARGEADYVWYTAALPPIDHCAGLRESVLPRR
jgi:uncharacterized iron-regulated protein